MEDMVFYVPFSKLMEEHGRWKQQSALRNIWSPNLKNMIILRLFRR